MAAIMETHRKDLGGLYRKAHQLYQRVEAKIAKTKKEQREAQLKCEAGLKRLADKLQELADQRDMAFKAEQAQIAAYLAWMKDRGLDTTSNRLAQFMTKRQQDKVTSSSSSGGDSSKRRKTT